MIVRVAGLDWATEATNRALVEVQFEIALGRVTITRIASPVPDQVVLDAACSDGLTVIAVDVPFGWPRRFAQFVGCWGLASASGDVEIPSGEQFAYRATDVFVRKTVGKRPLSVSSDRIALGALAWARLVSSHQLLGHVDFGAGRSGTDRPTLIEVYPAATLASWAKRGSLALDGYKKDPDVRRSLLRALFDRFAADVSEADESRLLSTGEDSDKTDAFIAALTALVYLGHLGSGVQRPGGEHVEPARTEGWIYFPV